MHLIKKAGNRKAHDVAYKKMCVFVKDDVIGQHKCYFITSLKEMYETILQKQYDSLGIIVSAKRFVNMAYVKSKILEHPALNKQIKIIKVNKKNVLAPFHIQKINNFNELTKNDLLDRAALKLRSIIRNL